MINVAKTVIEKDRKYLLIKRVATSKFFPDQWDFPGGKIHANEDPSNSAIRETREETSLNILIDNLMLEGDHTENGKQIHYRVYSTSSYEGKVKLSEDHSEFAWLSREQMEEYKTTPFVMKYFESI